MSYRTKKRKGLMRGCACIALSCCMLTAVSATSAFFVSAEDVPAAAGDTLAAQFRAPSAVAKPMVRYWLPAGAVDPEILRSDVRELHELGFGGVEVVSFLKFSNDVGEKGYGSAAWYDAMEAIVDEAKSLGMSVDVSNGPSWPISMPVEAGSDASAYELVYTEATVEGCMEGSIPSDGVLRTAKFVSAYAYPVVDGKLDHSKCVDLEEFITFGEYERDGTILWTAPSDGEWQLMFFFEQPTGQEVDKGEGVVIDHFGRAGAEACIDFWTEVFEEYPFMTYISNIFNDSLEYTASNEWTRGFLEIFEERKGYDISSYLPAIGQDDLYQTGSGPNKQFTDAELTMQIKNDYNDVLTYCYTEHHLKPLQEFAESYGMNIRYQVAYNKPMDTVTSAIYAGIPETETLNRGSLDQQRLMASAVHMTGKPIYSYESNAEFGNGYRQTYEDIVWWQKRAWSAGVNRQVLHGASYSGEGDNTTGDNWPGWSGFGGAISNDWNRTTSKENAAAAMTYLARGNYIMQKQAKVDVAVFRSTYEDRYMNNGADGEDWYPDGGVLNSYGYSYEFVSPEILSLESAEVEGGVLNAQGPAYKALVIHAQPQISYAAAERISLLNEAGWPVVIVGDAPSQLMYRSDLRSGHSDEDIARIFDEMLQRGNVKQIQTYAEVPEALAGLGVNADASYASPADVLAKHHTDASGEYYYLYNYNKMNKEDVNSTLCTGGSAYPFINKAEAFRDKIVTVTLKGEGRPYLMNAWDGTISAIPVYEETEGGIKLTLDLSGDEAVFIALLTDEEAQVNGIEVRGIHALSSDCTLDYDGDGLVVKATQNGEYSAVLSDGSEMTTTITGASDAFCISSWKLKIDYIEKGGSTLFPDSEWGSTEEVVLEELKGWKDIDEAWEDLSGIGTYTATFELDRGGDKGGGAYIDLGEVEDTYTVEVNGHLLPPTDLNDTLIDIGEYTVSGTNTIVVKVASTLYNRFIGSAGGMLKMMLPILSGSDILENTANGLLGTDGAVKVIPYSVAEVGGTDANSNAVRIVVGVVGGVVIVAGAVLVVVLIKKRRKGDGTPA